MKKVILLILSIITSSFAGPPYSICIDGGTTYTHLDVLDPEGKILYTNKSEGININQQSQKSVAKNLKNLLQDIPLNIKENSIVFAGIAGVDNQGNQEIFLKILASLNFYNAQVHSDGKLALNLIEEGGVIIIAGTGSVCFAKQGNQELRLGGLGSYLGDEGSGYYMGREALKAAIEEECGYGTPTALTPALKKHFNTTSLYPLIKRFSQDPEFFTHIATTAPTIFAVAKMGDPIANQIVNGAVEQLTSMIQEATSKIYFSSEIPIYLFGGIFRNPFFTERFFESPQLQALKKKYRLTYTNISSENAATLVAKRVISRHQPASESHSLPMKTPYVPSVTKSLFNPLP